MRASSRLHDWLLSAVMRAPMSFFDLTPRGRIVNRFSRDMDESTRFYDICAINRPTAVICLFFLIGRHCSFTLVFIRNLKRPMLTGLLDV